MHATEQPGFFWPPSEEVTPTSLVETRSRGWWESLETRLGRVVHPLRVDNLRSSSRSIVERLPDPEDWGESPAVFKGLVVGAVQSGKTESMMGVAAMAIDQGFRLVVVLTADSDDLRRQTALRFNSVLLEQSDRKHGRTDAYTIPGSRGPGPLGGYAPSYGNDVASQSKLSVLLDKHLRGETPVVLVVKKETVNLESLGAAMRSIDFSQFGHPLPMLVLDDECDEGSVGASGPADAIPWGIEQIWRSSLDNVRVVYIGYTATAAANLLQATDNPLYPSHFAYLLRYPQDKESPLTTGHPDFDAWYTGGEIFYRFFGIEPSDEANFLIRAEIDDAHHGIPEGSESLRNALIAYFVSAAYRLALSPERSFSSTDPADLPAPHSMLIQVSQNRRDHLRWRNAIRDILGGIDRGERTIGFDPDHLLAVLAAEEPEWEAWFASFDASRRRVCEQLRSRDPTPIVSWEDVKARIGEVFGNARLKIVNGDEEDGTSLDYEPAWAAEGMVAAQDNHVIVVGGQKLSRGITIEGLCISYFARESQHKPHADTVLQLSRWFGYRAKQLEFCRVFMTERTHAILLDIHENDQDYRKRLMSLNELYPNLEEARIALRESPSYALTAKKGPGVVTQNLRFSPFTHLFSRLEVGRLSESNQDWAVRVLEGAARAHKGKPVSAHGSGHGGILFPGWSASEIADLLDGLVAENGRWHSQRRIVVAHSFGGMLALSWLLRHGCAGRARIDGLVLIATTGGPMYEAVRLRVARLGPLDLRMGVTHSVRVWNTPLVTRTVKRLLSGGNLGALPVDFAKLKRKTDFALDLAGWRNTDWRAMRTFRVAMAGFDVRERLGGIRIPTMVLHGSEDAIFPPEVGERLAAALPMAEFRLVKGAAHGLPLTHGVEVKQAVRDLLGGGK
ncbi:MAG: alpha/beta fold hydrolase [Gemmatimonadetes bacterium]|nr:alpha/beta fold hydrolase [Gemmatimonadota bacterium]